MVPFTYRCPRTGQQVQGWAAADLGDSEAYEPVTCTACGRVHLVNPRTGKVLETAKNSPQPRVISSGSLAMFAATFAPQSNALRLTMHYGSDTRIPRAFVSTG